MNKPRLIQLVKKSGLAEKREEAALLIKSGRVAIDGKVVTNPNFQVRPSTHKITIDGKPLKLVEEKLYFILNKPPGFSSQKESGKKNVLDLIKIQDEKLKNTLFPVGRLDEDTSGLIIITNDGSLVHEILQPVKEVWKTYVATTNKDVPEAGLAKIRKGITIQLGHNQWFDCMSAFIEQIGPKRYEIKIREGKKRQVRRMLEAVGVHTEKLHRQAIGKLALPHGLRIGEYKQISKKEIEKIFEK
jgi:pseudouridine synthase